MIKALSCLLAILFTVSAIAADSNPTSWDLERKIRIQKQSRWIYDQAETEERSAAKLDLLTEKRRKLIPQLFQIIKTTKDNDRRTDFVFRLANLYMEDYFAKLELANRRQQKAMEKYTRKDGKDMPQLDLSSAMASLNRARELYRKLIETNPTHPKRDEMLYLYGLTSLDKGILPEAMTYFEKVAKEYPNSRFAQNAMVQLGDFYFEKSQWAQAETYYDRIINSKYQPLMPYAMYKKAWCSYNTGNTATSVQRFMWVVDNADPASNKGALGLRREALRDMILPFVDLKLQDKAVAYFRNFEDDIYREGLQNMALLFKDRGIYPIAIVLWDRLLELDEKWRDNPTYDTHVVESYRLNNQTDEALERLNSKVPAYREGSKWYEANSKDKALIVETDSGFEAQMRKYAFDVHATAQKTGSNDLYKRAKLWYTSYLTLFPKAAEKPRIQFSLAEISFRDKEYNKAAELYYQVYREPMKTGLESQAILSTLAALDKQLNIDRKSLGLSAINSKSDAKLKDNDESTEPVPFTPVEERFMDVSKEYLRRFSEAQNAADVMYERSYLQYVHYRFSDAEDGFNAILTKHPKHVTAYSAAHLNLDILNRQKKYDELIERSQKYLALDIEPKAKFRSEVASILRHAELKRIQVAEDKKQYIEAADGYVRYVKAYGPQDPALYEKALYNAAIDYSKGGSYVKSVELQEKFLKTFPKSALGLPMLTMLAQSAEEMADFGKAASLLERIADVSEDKQQVQRALYLAALYHWGSGNSRRAEKMLLDYKEDYKKEASKVNADLLSLWESQGMTNKVVGFYETERKKDGVNPADYVIYSGKIASIKAKKNGHAPSKLVAEVVDFGKHHPTAIKKSPKAADEYSKFLLWSLDGKDADYRHIRLTGGSQALQRKLKIKLELLKGLEKEYHHVATYGSEEWGLAAIYRTATLYRDLLKDIKEAPVPKELNAAQIQEYQGTLKKTMLDPFKTKTLTLVASCLDKSHEMRILSSWRNRCYSIGNELDGDKYPATRIAYLPPVYTAVTSPTAETFTNPEGSMPSSDLPLFAGQLFDSAPKERQIVSTASLEETIDEFIETAQTVPARFSYKIVDAERMKEIDHGIESNDPGSDRPEKYSFVYLALLIQKSPQKAVTSIKAALRLNPKDEGLHNLLGLAYLEANNYTAARITWKAQISMGHRNGAIWNNLGVLAVLEDKQEEAIRQFKQAVIVDNSVEANANLGYMALKYRQSDMAHDYFEQAMSSSKNDYLAQVGFLVSEIQAHETDGVEKKIVDLAEGHAGDPYARLNALYYIVDTTQNFPAAQALLDLNAKQSLSEVSVFRKVADQINRGVASQQKAEETKVAASNSPKGKSDKEASK